LIFPSARKPAMICEGDPSPGDPATPPPVFPVLPDRAWVNARLALVKGL